MKTQTGLTEREAELISRSLDEDLSEFELKQLSQKVLATDDGEKTWMRYHAVNAVISKQFPTQLDKNFSANVMQAISSEEQYTDDVGSENRDSGTVSTLRSYAKQVAGLAIAASVAAVSVVVYQQQGQPGLDGVPSIITSDKRAIEDFQPNIESPAVDSIPVEFSPVQPSNDIREELLILEREDIYPNSKAELDEENVPLQSPQTDVDIIKLEDIRK